MKWKEDFPSKQYPFFPLPVWDRVRNGIGNLPYASLLKTVFMFFKDPFFLIILYVVVESCLNSRKFLSYLIKGRQNRIKSRRG
jgi:hypothetical protein